MSIIASYIVPHPPLIIPEIGNGDEKKIQETINAYHKVAKEISEIKPDTIIISSPHALTYVDYFHISPIETMEGDFTQYDLNDLECYPKCDTELVYQIEKKAKSFDFPMGTLGSKPYKLDHGVTVPLYFINRYYDGYKLVVLGPSGLSGIDHYHVGKIIQSVVPRDKKVVWIASGDLSHKLTADGPYGYEPQGSVFDKEIVEALSNANFLKLLTYTPKHRQKIAECGVGSFTMMAGALDGILPKAELLSYEGPFGVGYSVIKYTDFEFSTSRHFDVIYKSIMDNSIVELRTSEDPYVKLARESLEYYVNNNRKYNPKLNFPNDLKDIKAGVFVSLHLNDRLRGCIGTVIPTKSNIAEEIIDNAISAGTRDYRFPPVKKRELDKIEYSVDVLSSPEQIDSIDKLDVKKYGVIVSSGHKTGLLLPNLEGIDTVDEQVSVALKKGGIEESDEYQLHRFEVIRHH